MYFVPFSHPWLFFFAAPSLILVPRLGTKPVPLQWKCRIFTNLCAQWLSLIRLLVTPWTVARQAPQSMGFSRQGYWSELPRPPPGDLPDSGIEPGPSAAPALQVESLIPHLLKCEQVFVISSNNLAENRILHWKSFSFRIWKIWFYYLLASGGVEGSEAIIFPDLKISL